MLGGRQRTISHVDHYVLILICTKNNRVEHQTYNFEDITAWVEAGIRNFNVLNEVNTDSGTGVGKIRTVMWEWKLWEYVFTQSRVYSVDLQGNGRAHSLGDEARSQGAWRGLFPLAPLSYPLCNWPRKLKSPNVCLNRLQSWSTGKAA